MAEDFGTPYPPFEEEAKKSNNTLLIIIIVVLLLLCCCCLIFGGGVTWLWYNGDALLEDLSLHLPYLFT